MSVELEDRIRDALAWRADDTTITAGATFDGRPPTPDERDPTRLRVALSAAAALLLVATGAVAVAITSRGGPTSIEVRTADGPGGQAGTARDTSPGTTTPARITGTAPMRTEDGSGRVGVPSDSPWTVTDASTSRMADTVVEYNWRIYATDGAVPESAPAFVVLSFPASENAPPSGTVDLHVQGVPAALVDGVGATRIVEFVIDGRFFRLTGHNVTDEELLRAAETARPSPDRNGAVLAQSALPEGVYEQIVGEVGAQALTSASAAAQPAVTLRLEVDSTSATYLSVADQRIARLNRLLFDEITAVDINGSAGYVGSMEQFGFTAVVWTTEGRTNTVYADGTLPTELVMLARSLQPVTDEEWMAMLEETRTSAPVHVCRPLEATTPCPTAPTSTPPG